MKYCFLVIKISFKKSVNRLISDKPKTSRSEEAEESQEEAEEMDERDEDDGTGEDDDDNGTDSDPNASQESLSSGQTGVTVKIENEKEVVAQVKVEPSEMKETNEGISVKKEPSESLVKVKSEASVKKEEAPAQSKPAQAVSSSVKAVFKVPGDKSKPEKRKQSALDEIIQVRG